MIKHQEAGAFLKKIRINAGVGQRELADALGFEYYTFMAVVESGKAMLPSAHIQTLCRVCSVDASEVGKTLLMYYDPDLYISIFVPCKK